MTKAYDIYKRTLSIMFEHEGKDTSFFEMFPHILNMVLWEALPYENSIRASSGMEELRAAPQICSLHDDVDMSNGICSVALPYGVASYFSKDDGNSYDAMLYRERFIDALNEAKRCRLEPIIDVYGGEGE